MFDARSVCMERTSQVVFPSIQKSCKYFRVSFGSEHSYTAIKQLSGIVHVSTHDSTLKQAVPAEQVADTEAPKWRGPEGDKHI